MLPEPLLSVVATLFVWVVVPLRSALLDSAERSWDVETDDRDTMEVTELSELSRLLSTTVGLRGRPGVSSNPPYMLIVLLTCVRPKSCMSLRYAITDRNARVRASLAFSSSRRWICSMGFVCIGLGTGLVLSSVSSASFAAVTPGTNCDGGGMGIGDISMGRKLLRFAARLVGCGKPSRLVEGVGDFGAARREFSSGDATGISRIVGGTALRTSSLGCLERRPSDGWRSVPVVEIRTSICGVKEALAKSAAEDNDLSIAPGCDFEGRRGRELAMEGRAPLTGSARIFPIDIFFRNPHLVDLVSSLLLAGVSSW